MITPLMHILSCLDDKYQVGAPVDILYLNREDRDLIVSEAKRIVSILRDTEIINLEQSATDLQMVSTSQNMCGSSISINPYTALLLTEVRRCSDIYLREVDITVSSSSEEDLSTDAVILRLEGNPKSVYAHVYNTMTTNSLTYSAKIARLYDLLVTIKEHTVIEDTQKENTKLLSRLSLHSKISYWKCLLMEDYIRYFGVAPLTFTEDTIEIVRKELKDLGFYGFINPLLMYQEFSGARIARKVNINIEEFVIDFLTVVVRSGGVDIS